MTDTQKAIFEFIRGYWYRNSYAPTNLEIASFIGISENSIGKNIAVLIELGYIEKTKEKRRNIEVTTKGENLFL